MASRRRWSHLIHSFRAGVLSPSVQDQIDSDAWLQGAARLDNLSVERDGGVRGRPPFLNGEEIPTVKWDLMPGATVSPAIPDGGLELTLTQAGTVLTITFPEPGVKPRSIVFHQTELFGATSTDRLTYTTGGKTERNFTLWGRKSKESTFDHRVPRADSPTSDVTSANLFWGHFMPGGIARDIVVPLKLLADNDVSVTAPLNAITGLQLRVAEADPMANRIGLRIGGVSMLSEEDLASPYKAATGYGDAYRLIPWIIRDDPFVLVLGMDYSAVFAYTREGLSQRAGRGTMLRNPNTDMPEEVVFAPGSFSYRQIRELTWTPYGGGLLLFHRDFLRPIRVRLDVGPELKMEVLGTRGIADLTDQLESLRAPAI